MTYTVRQHGNTAVSRRRLLALIGGAAGAAILAACGDEAVSVSTPTTVARPTTGGAATVGGGASAAPPTSIGAASAVATTAPSAVTTTGGASAVAPTVTRAASAVTGATTTTGAASAIVPATGGAASAVAPTGAAAGVATPTRAASAVTGTTTAGSAVAGTAAMGSATMLPTLDIESFDFGFRTVGSVPGGPTLVRQRNTGKENHHAQLIRLKSSVTQEQLLAALPKGESAIFTLTENAGGPGAVAGGGVSEVIYTLQEGDYALICYIPSPMDGIRHFAKGMILPLRITAAPASAAAVKLPETVGTVVMNDFAFKMPVGTVKAGKSYWNVVNEGVQPHEFNIVRLQPGKTPADITAFFAGPPMGPPPFINAGGFNGLEKGASGIAVLDLQAGEYAAICNIPDVSGSGKSHLQLGMIAGLSVR